jgi:hypothetical protein
VDKILVLVGLGATVLMAVFAWLYAQASKKAAFVDAARRAVEASEKLVEQQRKAIKAREKYIGQLESEVIAELDPTELVDRLNGLFSKNNSKGTN